MKSHIRKALCLLLSVCLLFALAGCQKPSDIVASTAATTEATEPEVKHPVVIACENVALGSAPEEITVSVRHADADLPHTLTWYVSNEDTRTEMVPGDVLEPGCYELHINYRMKGSWPTPVTVKDNVGTLIVSKQLSGDSFIAVVRFFFSDESK